ncbi:MAG: methionyl-tRNA formyltransferase, partial [Rikenellaceae bacterium]
INWAMINGDTTTGVTTFMLDEQIDTGDIIDYREVKIEESDNFKSLHDKLMNVGAQLVEESVKQIASETLKLKPQRENSQMRGAPKIFKETCKIDWNNDCRTIFNFVRGLSPYPTAWTDFKGAYGDQFSMKIYEVNIEFTPHNRAIGEVVTDNRTFVKVACKDGYVLLKNIQIAGKKQMDIVSYLCGNKM